MTVKGEGRAVCLSGAGTLSRPALACRLRYSWTALGVNRRMQRTSPKLCS